MNNQRNRIERLESKAEQLKDEIIVKGLEGELFKICGQIGRGEYKPKQVTDGILKQIRLEGNYLASEQQGSYLLDYYLTLSAKIVELKRQRNNFNRKSKELGYDKAVEWLNSKGAQAAANAVTISTLLITVAAMIMKKIISDSQSDSLYFSHSFEQPRRQNNVTQKLDTDCNVEEHYLWDFIRLGLDIKYVEVIRSQRYEIDAHSIGTKIIESECLVRECFGHAAHNLGSSYVDLEHGLKFKQLLDCWENAMKQTEHSSDWIEYVYETMICAILNVPTIPIWSLPLMRSALPHTDWWFSPIINHARVLPDEGYMEFDLYFYRVAIDDEKRETIRL